MDHARTAADSSSTPPDGAAPAGGAIVDAAHLVDRQRRDDLRRRILEHWAAGAKGDEVAAEAKQGRFEEHPNADGWGIDPKYIQSAMKQEMLPMVQACYADYLVRAPDAGGRVQLWFKIVADDQLGGIVEEDVVDDAGPPDEDRLGSIDGDFGDAKMRTCVRESLLTVTFPPPAKGGVVTIGYPIVLSTHDDDDDGGDGKNQGVAR